MKKMEFEDCSKKTNSTVFAWYQDTIKFLQVDRKLNTLPELVITDMKSDCQTLEYTTHLINETTKKLDFVLKVLSPFVAVYPIIKSALTVMNNVKGTLQQLNGFMKKRIAFNEESIDWNLSVTLQEEEIFNSKIEKYEDFKLCSSIDDSEYQGMDTDKNSSEIRTYPVKISLFNKKDFIVICIISIFIMFDPLGVFKIYG